MLVINADDWGGWRKATDAAHVCFCDGRIDSSTAMVFMDDSERGADIAKDCGIDIGLHLNLNKELDYYPKEHQKLNYHHEKVYRFLQKNKYALIFYNPLIRDSIDYIIKAQFDEFQRLFHKMPTHIDGHQHMHLCTNILVDRLLPIGSVVRRSFTFYRGQKNLFNRLYRRLVDLVLESRHITTEYFFSLSQLLKNNNFSHLVDLARKSSVELMVHPEWPIENCFLRGDQFPKITEELKRGNFKDLSMSRKI